MPLTPGRPSRTRALLCAVVASGALVLTPALPAAASPDDTVDPAVTTTVPVTDTTNEFLDLERELSECVGNFNARPGCGREPTHAGDRGGPLQWTVFAVMGAGLAFIGWRITRGMRQRERTLNHPAP